MMKTIFNNKWISFFVLLLLVANVITLSLLWKNQKTIISNNSTKNDEHRHRIADFLINELQLNKDQQQQYELLIQEHRNMQKPIVDSIKMAKEKFYEFLQKNDDNSRIEKANELIASFELKLNQNNFNHFKKLRAICDNTQQSKFDSVIKEVLMQMGNSPKNEPPPPFDQRKNDDQVPNTTNIDKEPRN